MSRVCFIYLEPEPSRRLSVRLRNENLLTYPLCMRCVKRETHPQGINIKRKDSLSNFLRFTFYVLRRDFNRVSLSTYDHKQILADYAHDRITVKVAVGRSLQHIAKLYEA